MRSQRGSTMVVVMVLLVALLSAGAVAVQIQSADTRTTGLVGAARRALFCAEAGLETHGQAIVDQKAAWNDLLAGNPVAGVSYPFVGSIDGSGTIDYEVRIRDNFDDDDQLSDIDGKVFIVSRCLKYADTTPREIMQLISVKLEKSDYDAQLGGGGAGDGNMNKATIPR
jgi:hypothetical protein